jgi:PhzF family phenazine biosynthesis protein
MAVRVFYIDAFTGKAFAGNQAAVCLLDQAADEQWMQSVAAEIGFSETAFIVRKGNDFSLRWFTPSCEMELCGHATLASAHALWQEGWLTRDKKAVFHTAGGVLTAKEISSGIEMDFPAESAATAEAPHGLAEALGAEPKHIARSRMDILVEVDDAATVRNLIPDMVMLRKIDTRGVIVTAVSDVPEYDFVSRFFAPGIGIDEDPVTGSAHCCLGPYWQTRLGKSDFRAYQASKRGGVIGVKVRGDRILLTGSAVTVLRGELLVSLRGTRTTPWLS